MKYHKIAHFLTTFTITREKNAYRLEVLSSTHFEDPSRIIPTISPLCLYPYSRLAIF